MSFNNTFGSSSPSAKGYVSFGNNPIVSTDRLFYNVARHADNRVGYNQETDGRRN